MNVNEIIAMIVSAVLVPLITWGILVARNYLLAKIKTEQVQAILIQASDAASKAVAEVAQTYVDGIKGTEGWDETTQRKAANMALSRARDMLGKDGMDLLYSVTGSAYTYLQAAIEQAVKDYKI